jgi:nitroimidazol reductase NimA-like FMN-containing flavoprotein (pyridoxamine 5'-phosphate oxidase superfamily)
MPDNKADLSSPGGSAPRGSGAGPRSVVERLDEAECMELLGAGRIGRLIYSSRYGPVALPSEYKIHEGSIIFRTYRTTFTEEDEVAFEADQTDPDAREGWLVLVLGSAHHIDTEAERASIADVGLKSWVEGEPEHFIRVDPIRVSGQRIRQA